MVKRLVEWAAAALEKSTNQPVHPNLVLVLNASENAINGAEWDVDVATQKLLESIREALAQPSLNEYARTRTGSKRKIKTAEDLLFSYYRSVRVVRIPTNGRPQLINDQMDKLYQEILDGCEKSRISKRGMRMLLSADELQSYLQDAFDHFSSKLDTPFDFVKASFLHNPIPADFGGNILKLAINVMEVFQNKLDAAGIFKELSPMVASCIMLDSARHKTKGIWSTPSGRIFSNRDANPSCQVALKPYFVSITYFIVMMRSKTSALVIGHVNSAAKPGDASMSEVVTVRKGTS